VRRARASTGRCFLSGGEGILVRQSRRRYTELRPFARCLDGSWALKAEREGKEGGSLAGTGLAFGEGAGDPQGRKGPSVPAVAIDRGKAGFAGEGGGWRGEKIVRFPRLDSVPEAVHASECGGVGSEEIGTVGKYGNEEGVGDAVG